MSDYLVGQTLYSRNWRVEVSPAGDENTLGIPGWRVLCVRLALTLPNLIEVQNVYAVNRNEAMRIAVASVADFLGVET